MRKKIKLIFLSILLLGLIFRAYQLGKECLLIDEVLTLNKSSDSISSLIKHRFSAGHFPTYFIMMHYWIKLFGNNEFILRLPSLIFGVLSIYAIFLLGRKLFNERIGILASFLFAVSPVNIYYSQYAKPYSMTVFFVALSFLFLIKGLESNTKLSWFGYVFYTSIALILSISASLIIICQILFIILSWRRYKEYVSMKRVISVFTLIFLIYAPSLVIFFGAILKSKHYTISGLPSLDAMSITNIFNLFGSKVNLDIIGRGHDFNLTQDTAMQGIINIYGIFLFLLCLRGIFVSIKSRTAKEYANKEERGASVKLLFIWLFMPIFLSLAFSYLFTPVFGPVKYVLYTSCAYYLLVAKGIASFGRKTSILLILSIILTTPIFLQEYYSVEKRTDWRGVCNYITVSIKDDEAVAFIDDRVPFSEEEILMRHYSNLPVIGICPKRPIKDLSANEVSMPQRNNATLSFGGDLKYGGIWLISNSPLANRLCLSDKYVLMETKIFNAIEVYHYRFTNRLGFLGILSYKI